MKGDCRIYAAFGDLVYRARSTLHLSQKEVADTVGVSRPTIINIEKGRRGTSLILALKLTKYLGLDLTKVLDAAQGLPDPKRQRNARIRRQIEDLKSKLFSEA